MAPPCGLVATLRGISLDATDAFVEALREHGCVGQARLVCQGLRQVVDGSVKSLLLSAKPEFESASRWPSLAIWPRVEEISYRIQDLVEQEDVRYFVEKWIAWAGSQSPLSLGKVTTLRLGWSPAHDEGASTACPSFTAPIAACLALWFPNLKELDFDGCSESSFPEEGGHLPQLTAMIAGGLGRLQQLHKLTLPSVSLLAALGEMQPPRKDAAASGAGGAATSTTAGANSGSTASSGGGGGGGGGWFDGLQELAIAAPDAQYVTDEVAAGVGSLRSLRLLQLGQGAAHDGSVCTAGLVNLMQHVPPSLTRLSVSPWLGSGPLVNGFEGTFEAGHLREVSFVVDDIDLFRSVPLWQLGDAAADLLLPYLKPRYAMLRRLVVRRLQLPQRGHEHAQLAQLPTDAQVEAVRKLAQRCRTVELQEAEVLPSSDLQALDQAAELLGAPQALRLVTVFRYPLMVPLLLPLTASNTALAHAAQGQGQGHRVSAGAQDMAVDSSASVQSPLAQLPQEPQQPQQEPQQQPQQQPQQPAAEGPSLPPLLSALSGPAQALVSRAVQRLLAMPRVPPPSADQSAASWHAARLLVLRGPLVTGLAQSPELVDGWVKWLTTAGVASPQDQSKAWYGRYLLVPRALGGPALLMQARGGRGDGAALDALVRSVVEPGAQLEAVWVAVQRYPGYPGDTLLPAPLLWCVQQELDENWDATGVSGRSTAAGSGMAAAATPAAPPSLQDQAQWLQRLGRVLAEELPACKAFKY